MNRIGKNAIYNFGGIAAGMLVLLIATPVYIKYLGIDQFGLFTLISSITAPLGILNAGISQSATKFVAQYIAAGDYVKAAESVQTSAFLNLAFGMAGCAILIALAPWLAVSVFKIPASLHQSATIAFRIAGVIWLSTQMAQTYQAVITGVQKFDTLALHNALQSLLMYGLGAAVVCFSPSIVSVLLVSLGVSTLYWLIWYLKARESIRHLPVGPRWSSKQAKETWAFSGWQILNAIVGLLGNHADRLLLGTLKGTGLVGFYGIALSIQSRLVTLIWSLLGTLFPAASAASTQENKSELLVLRYGWAFAILGMALYGTVFVVGPDFLVLWLGQKVGLQTAPVLQVLLLVAFVGLPSAVLYHYLLGHGLTKWLSLGNIATSACTVLLAWVFISHYGLLGAAWSGVAGILLTRPIFHLWVMKQRFQFGEGLVRHFSLLYSSQVSGAIAIGFAWFIYQRGLFVSNLYIRIGLGAMLVPLVSLAAMFLLERLVFGHFFPIKKILENLLESRRRGSVASPETVRGEKA
jgi:O-antigen/teichoic acid export membrane protein